MGIAGAAQRPEVGVVRDDGGIPLWFEHRGEGVLFATALHSGHLLRPELAERIALDEATRLREEDPVTDKWAAAVASSWLIPVRSRFEVDLNRAREQAVYLLPEDAWSLKVWNNTPTNAMIRRSLAEYDAFYRELERFLREMEQRYGRFVVYDLHAYNHRRDGPDRPPADPATHPDINLGTGTMDRQRWAPVVERFLHDLRRFDFPGRRLTVGENVVFRGRHLPAWIHRRFPATGCALAIEVKKFYMDEWSGRVDPILVRAVQEAIASTVPGVIEAISSEDYVVVQEYLPQASCGDTRLFVMNGEPLQHQGRYAALQRARAPGDGDMRSNMSAGALPRPATVGDEMLQLVEMVRPRLVQDGMFLVGLDIVGDKLMEINVFSPGGLHSAERFTGVQFSRLIIHALERKVEQLRRYHHRIGNREIAVL